MSALLRIVAIFSSVFRVISPDSRLRFVVVGGLVSIVLISSAVCLKKSSIFTFGKEMTFGKKVTISISCRDLVFEKKHFMHL